MCVKRAVFRINALTQAAGNALTVTLVIIRVAPRVKRTVRNAQIIQLVTWRPMDSFWLINSKLRHAWHNAKLVVTHLHVTYVLRLTLLSALILTSQHSVLSAVTTDSSLMQLQINVIVVKKTARNVLEHKPARQQTMVSLWPQENQLLKNVTQHVKHAVMVSSVWPALTRTPKLGEIKWTQNYARQKIVTQAHSQMH